MSAREELATMTVGEMLAERPYVAVFADEDREALSNLPAPVAPTPPAR